MDDHASLVSLCFVCVCVAVRGPGSSECCSVCPVSAEPPAWWKRVKQSVWGIGRIICNGRGPVYAVCLEDVPDGREARTLWSSQLSSPCVAGSCVLVLYNSQAKLWHSCPGHSPQILCRRWWGPIEAIRDMNKKLDWLSLPLSRSAGEYGQLTSYKSLQPSILFCQH